MNTISVPASLSSTCERTAPRSPGPRVSGAPRMICPSLRARRQRKDTTSPRNTAYRMFKMSYTLYVLSKHVFYIQCTKSPAFNCIKMAWVAGFGTTNTGNTDAVCAFFLFAHHPSLRLSRPWRSVRTEFVGLTAKKNLDKHGERLNQPLFDTINRYWKFGKKWRP